jgi:hypothetical protein
MYGIVSTKAFADVYSAFIAVHFDDVCRGQGLNLARFTTEGAGDVGAVYACHEGAPARPVDRVMAS